MRDFFLPPLERERGGPAGEPESVSGLTTRIRETLVREIGAVWVRGEISNLRRQASGHVYFSLKDETSQVAAVCFRGQAARLRVNLRDGLRVVVAGEINVYEPRGTYQIVVREVIEDGLGRLQQALEELKQKLAAEGLFDAEGKRELPGLPLRVGFVTSPGGAAVQDFIRILKRRRWPGTLVVLPARVQGREAEGELVRGLAAAAALRPALDLVVIGRGGGSLEDLWAFNLEAVVRAVAASPLPVISAVGHETDVVLTDFAADLRAETPSAAAELISSAFLAAAERAAGARRELIRVVERALREHRQGLNVLAAEWAGRSPVRRLETLAQRLDELEWRMGRTVRDGVRTLRHRRERLGDRLRSVDPLPDLRRRSEHLADRRARLIRATDVGLRRLAAEVAGLRPRLAALDPRSVLRRGYAMVRRLDGDMVVRRDTVRAGERLEVEFADGRLPVRAEEDPDKGPESR